MDCLAVRVLIGGIGGFGGLADHANVKGHLIREETEAKARGVAQNLAAFIAHPVWIIERNAVGGR